MKAAVYSQYGPPEVLQIVDIPKPQPKENELLVKIEAATVTSGDARLRASDFPPIFWLPARLIFGLFKPKKTIIGHEFSGTVVQMGNKIDRFKLGDEVFGSTTMLKAGSYAQYVCVPEQWKHGVVTHKPKNLNHTQAAALPIGAMTAMYLLEKAKLKKGQNVLIYGASGSVGSYALQLAKLYAQSVTAVCSGRNQEMVTSLGADVVIDYKKDDFSKSKDRYDLVFDAVGKIGKSKARKVLNPNGSFVSIKMLTKERDADLNRIKMLAEQNLLVPFIDKTYPLNEIVEAHRYVDSGRKRGNVCIEIPH